VKEARFPDLLLTRFDGAKEIDIETRSAEGAVHKVTIWIVVQDERAGTAWAKRTVNVVP